MDNNYILIMHYLAEDLPMIMICHFKKYHEYMSKIYYLRFLSIPQILFKILQYLILYPSTSTSSSIYQFFLLLMLVWIFNPFLFYSHCHFIGDSVVFNSWPIHSVGFRTHSISFVSNYFLMIVINLSELYLSDPQNTKEQNFYLLA